MTQQKYSAKKLKVNGIQKTDHRPKIGLLIRIFLERKESVSLFLHIILFLYSLSIIFSETDYYSDIDFKRLITTTIILNLLSIFALFSIIFGANNSLVEVEKQYSKSIIFRLKSLCFLVFSIIVIFIQYALRLLPEILPKFCFNIASFSIIVLLFVLTFYYTTRHTLTFNSLRVKIVVSILYFFLLLGCLLAWGISSAFLIGDFVRD